MPLPFSTSRFRILEPQWLLVDRQAINQQAADELGGDELGRASEEGLGEFWEALGGRGRYGRQLGRSQISVLTPGGGWKILEVTTPRPFTPMSVEQLKAFWEAVQVDAGLQEKLKRAGDLDAFLAIAKEAGFDISKATWLKYQARQTLELTDEQLEGVSGGSLFPVLVAPWDLC